MPAPSRYAVAAFVVATLSMLSVGDSHASMHPTAQVPAVGPPAPAIGVEWAFVQAMRDDLQHARFELLDDTANNLWRTKVRFPGGYWKLFVFHAALARPFGGTWDPPENAVRRGTSVNEVENQRWGRHLALLMKWRAARPQSMAAIIALGDAWILYGWHARGEGYADTVTDSARAILDERLGRSERVLRELERVPVKPPQWYWTMIILAYAQGWPRERLEALFDEAVASEPLYLHLYSAKAMYLLPRWHGEDGEWERFAETSAARLTGAEGSAVYGHIAWQVSELYAGESFFKQNRVSWIRVRQGFIDREALYGTNNHILNAFSLMAGNARDRSTTRGLMDRIGDAWDPKVWKERQYFDRYRAWAFK